MNNLILFPKKRLISSVKELPLGKETAIGIYRKVLSDNSFILQSSLLDEKLGKYSYIGFDPFLVFKSKGKNYWINGKKRMGAPLNALREIIYSFKVERKECMPLFCGGAAGYFSYDIVHFLENLPKNAKDDLKLPDIYFIFVDKLIAFDHISRKIKLIALGNNRKEAEEKIRDIEMKIKGREDKIKRKKSMKGIDKKIKSNFSKKAYINAVKKVKDYIMAGDAFQVNLSKRLQVGIACEPIELYEKLMQTNPAPFSAFLNLDGFQIASSSPERLVKVEKGIVTTRPIGGTRPRGRNSEEDKSLEEELLSSEKEKAEHAMLVDLERNDIGRISCYGTVRPKELFTVERYAKVMHLVSEIEGILCKDKDCFDVLKAMFPGGTITGCPKVRVMEIIDELEPTARGPYTGSIGFINFNNEMDLNIAIRTLIIKDSIAYLNVGGGIVADSRPEKEYKETLHKAEALIDALNKV